MGNKCCGQHFADGHVQFGGHAVNQPHHLSTMADSIAEPVFRMCIFGVVPSRGLSDEHIAKVGLREIWHVGTEADVATVD